MTIEDRCEHGNWPHECIHCKHNIVLRQTAEIQGLKNTITQLQHTIATLKAQIQQQKIVSKAVGYKEYDYVTEEEGRPAV
jgi:hypothetical protein